MNAKEFRRWLKENGCEFDESRGKGGHIQVKLGNKKTYLPMHGHKELGKGLVETIKKQLGLKIGV